MWNNQRFVIAALITLVCIAAGAYVIGRLSLEWTAAPEGEAALAGES